MLKLDAESPPTTPRPPADQVLTPPPLYPRDARRAAPALMAAYLGRPLFSFIQATAPSVHATGYRVITRGSIYRKHK
jgi:hypothetical protein